MNVTIKVGDRLPQTEFRVMTSDGEQTVMTDAVFLGRRVVLFGVPGAFTRNCSKVHLPGFIAHHDAIKAKGIDTIACTAVNDADVMSAWSVQQGAEGLITMLSDGNASFAKACGLERDLTASGMGLRSRRYSMIVENGEVKVLNVEPAPGVNASKAEVILSQL